MPVPPSYFVCYSRRDRELVTHIEAKLASRRRRGEIDLWVDRTNIHVGRRIDPAIEAALQRASGAIVLIGDNWQSSNYAQHEEWPRIKQRADSEESFALFLLALERLSADDPLRGRRFINDVDEPFIQMEDARRDQVLTELSDHLGDHARSLRSIIRPTAVDRETVVDAAPRAPAAMVRAVDRIEPVVDLRKLPEEPRPFIRPPELADLCARVLAHAKTGITGRSNEGGTGKTVLAAAVARLSAAAFDGDVHWITIGERSTREDVRRRQADLLRMLDAAGVGQPRDLAHGRELLREVLVDRRALIVVDDIWHPWHGWAFDAADDGDTAHLLYTTRLIETLPVGTIPVPIDRMSRPEATRFLANAAGSLPEPDQLDAVLTVADGLRLALAVLAATARSEGSWAAVLRRLDGVSARFGSGDDASSAHKALHIGTEALEPADRARLWTLAVLPEDTTVPVSVLAELWSTDRVAALDTVHRLADREMVTVENEAVELHDHVHDFLRLRNPGRAAEIHLALWELALRWSEGGAWTDLADFVPYLWDRLVWHAVRADLNGATLVDLVTDAQWLGTRIGLDGAAIAEQDVERVCERLAIGPDEPLNLLRRVLRHGALFDSLTNDPDGQALTLLSWADASFGRRGDGASLRSGSLPVPGRGLTRTLRGHTDQVRAVAFHPEGGQIATASLDGTARIWDVATGDSTRVLRGHDGPVRGVAYDATGRRLVTASSDRTARIWDAVTGQTVAVLRGHVDQVRAAAFDPTGSFVATASADGTARVWDASTASSLVRLTGHSDEVRHVTFDPEGRRVATASSDGTARVWNARTGDVLAVLRKHRGHVRAVRFDPLGVRLATAGADGMIRVWSPHTGDELAQHGTLLAHLRDVAFDRDGVRIAGACADGTTRVWHAASGMPLATLVGHTDQVRGVAFDPTGQFIATGSSDGTARIWDPSASDALPPSAAHRDQVRGLAFDPAGRRLATASLDGTARVWDLGNGHNAVCTFYGHQDQVRSTAFCPTGRRVATASADRTVRVWDPLTGDELAVLVGHTDHVRAVTFDRSGHLLASASADGTVRIWDSETASTLAVLTGHTDHVRGVAFDPAGVHLATASSDGTVRVWDRRDGATLATLVGHTDAVRDVAFDPTGNRLATASADGTARIWAPGSARTTAVLSGHVNQVQGVAFDGAGARLATASLDGTARIWDAATGACLHTLALACSGAVAWHGDLLAVAAGWHWAVVDLGST